MHGPQLYLASCVPRIMPTPCDIYSLGPGGGPHDFINIGPRGPFSGGPKYNYVTPGVEGAGTPD